MALVLGLAVGDMVDIVDHWIAVISVDSRRTATLTVRDLTKDDAVMQERGTIPRAALEMDDEGSDEISRVQSVRAKVTA